MGVYLTKHHIVLLSILAFSLGSLQFVLAHDGGHDNCWQNGLPPGHTTPWTDPECAVNATDGCDVRALDALNFPGGNLSIGVDICGSNRTIDCNNNAMNGASGNTGIQQGLFLNINSSNIKNCRIQGYTTGIELFLWSSNFTIDGNAITSSGNGLVINGNFHIIKNNNITSRVNGIYTSSVPNLGILILNNTIQTERRSNTAGIALNAGTFMLIAGNTFRAVSKGIHSRYADSNINNNFITNNTFTDEVGYAIYFDVRSGNNNFIWRNTISGRGIADGGKESTTNIYCRDVGNLYVNVLDENPPYGYIRAPNDCGPLPNVTTISVNPSHTSPIEFNQGLTGTFFTNASPRDAAINTNAFLPQTVLLEPNSGPYLTPDQGIILKYQDLTTLDCGNNTLQTTSWYSGLIAISVARSDNVTLKNCRTEPNGPMSYEDAISVYSSQFASIANNTIRLSRRGIILDYSPGATVSNNIVIGNSGFSSGGMRISNSPFFALVNNVVMSSQYGITLLNSPGSIAKGNAILPLSSNIGLYLGSNNILLENNTIAFSYIAGVYIISGENITMHFSNLHNNSGYNVQNTQPNSVDARYNWWGTANQSEIQRKIYDSNQNPAYGPVLFVPFLTAPYPQQLSILTTTLSAALVGQYASEQFVATGGTPPYTWYLAGGSLPSGMSMHPDGVLNGTPSNAGNFTFIARVTDSNNSIAEKSFIKEVFVTLPPPHLGINKVGTIAVPGRALDYFIRLYNLANVQTNEVTVAEKIDPFIFNLTEYQTPATLELGEEEETTYLLVWNVSLLPYESKLFSYKARLDPGTPIGTEVIGGPVCIPKRVQCGGSLTPAFSSPPLQGPEPLQVCPRMPPGGAGGYQCRSDGGHRGVDLTTQSGSPVLAVEGGRVEYAQCQPPLPNQPSEPNCNGNQHGYGYNVRVRHSNGCLGIYAHLSVMNVRPNENVAAGQVIGYSGRSGSAYNVPCSHLHFEYRCPGSSNPRGEINPCGGLGNPPSCSCSCTVLECDEDRQSATRPVDPNEKGSIADRFIKSNQLLVYPIHFENVGNTSAFDIFVTDQLNQPMLNFSSLKVMAKNGTFIPIGANERIIIFERQKNRTIWIGNITINQTVNESWTALLTNSILRWELVNIDLDINATDQVLFSVIPRQGLTSGTAIRNNATIQFEIFESITTNTVENIIDEVAPSCTMNQLPNITTSLNFTIAWNGTDPIGEIDYHTIFASVNGGGFNQVINTTQNMNATFIGEQGRRYSFICIATDTAGNTEVQAPNAEASTVIPGAHLELVGIPQIGTTVNLSVSDWAHPGNKYVLAMSLGTSPGIPLGDGRIIPLNPDIIFLLSLQAGQLIGLRNNINFLNAQGQGTTYWDIPNVPELAGITVYSAAVVIDHTLPAPFVSISNAVPIQIV